MDRGSCGNKNRFNPSGTEFYNFPELPDLSRRIFKTGGYGNKSGRVVRFQLNFDRSIEIFRFFRCNKCYLVNLDYVDSVQNNDICIGKDVVRVSRAKKKEFMDTLNNYINEVSK